MKTFGLIGKKLTHSFSKEYFNKKFQKSNLENYQYNNYEIKNLDEIEQLLKTEKLCGLNVTIPYKQEIINYLDNIEITAKEIGSVNTLKIKEKCEMISRKYQNNIEQIVKKLPIEKENKVIFNEISEFLKNREN